MFPGICTHIHQSSIERSNEIGHMNRRRQICCDSHFLFWICLPSGSLADVRGEYKGGFGEHLNYGPSGEGWLVVCHVGVDDGRRRWVTYWNFASRGQAFILSHHTKEQYKLARRMARGAQSEENAKPHSETDLTSALVACLPVLGRWNRIGRERESVCVITIITSIYYCPLIGCELWRPCLRWYHQGIQ